MSGPEGTRTLDLRRDRAASTPTGLQDQMLLIVLEYPSRSNLNCLIVVLRGLGRKGDEFLNLSWIVDIREIEKTIIILWKIVDSNHSREDLIYSQVAVSERLLLPNLYLVVESNHFPLHVKQIRFRYANKANCTE